ncbi:PPA1309 family protein [Tessaracoccus sp. OH4464_COT-324]|uniref:PPA1309 family protein n=1 Tax=Tessaracoccus sp. OH4464_COT-324 TaxID=2491059 RepID=UPI001F2B50C7|nr:PPA1309 family protein [Tessaracoccus sp. OH4464_COT-324]
MSDRLVAVLLDIEQHVAELGWDQPARLFALVPTAELIRMEPHLTGQLAQGTPDALSAVEQDEFKATDNLAAKLAEIYFPETVEGVAITLERTFLPAKYESDVPEDDAAAVDFVRSHPEHEEIRAVVGVLRDGSRHCLARLKSHPEELLRGEDVIPNLPEALGQTLRREP